MNTITVTIAADLFPNTFGQCSQAADYLNEIGAVGLAGIGGGYLNCETDPLTVGEPGSPSNAAFADRPDNYIAFYQAEVKPGYSYRFATSAGAGITIEDDDMGAFAAIAESCDVRLA